MSITLLRVDCLLRIYKMRGCSFLRNYAHTSTLTSQLLNYSTRKLQNKMHMCREDCVHGRIYTRVGLVIGFFPKQRTGKKYDN